AERRDETTRTRLQRADRLEQRVRQQGVHFGEIGGGGETEERQVAKEHGFPGAGGNDGVPAWPAAVSWTAPGAGSAPASEGKESPGTTAWPWPGARNSNSRGSASCEGSMLAIARAIWSMRPGWSRSHCASIRPTCTRCRFCWLPHRLQGMIGKRLAFAYS